MGKDQLIEAHCDSRRTKMLAAYNALKHVLPADRSIVIGWVVKGQIDGTRLELLMNDYRKALGRCNGFH
jgi:hypothetical protein